MIALCGKIGDPAISFQLELHSLITCEEQGMTTTDVEGISESSIHKKEDTRQTVNGRESAGTIKSYFLFIRDALSTKDWLTVLSLGLTSICECASLIKGKQNTIFV